VAGRARPSPAAEWMTVAEAAASSGCRHFGSETLPIAKVSQCQGAAIVREWTGRVSKRLSTARESSPLAPLQAAHPPPILT
jgi:hypothetical protein